MGYCVSVVEHDFKIKYENIDKIVKEINKYSLASGKQRWLDSDNIVDIFGDLSYTLEFKKDFYCITGFNGKKLGDEFGIFNLIATYVEEGSYITYRSENEHTFSYVIHRGKCKEFGVETYCEETIALNDNCSMCNSNNESYNESGNCVRYTDGSWVLQVETLSYDYYNDKYDMEYIDVSYCPMCGMDLSLL